MYTPKELKTGTQTNIYMYLHVLSSTIYDSQKVETQMSISG